MKMLWVVTCICCTFSIWLWNLYTHIPTPKDVRNIPPTKKNNKKKHNTFSRSGYQKVKPPKNTHKTNQPSHQGPTPPPFQTSPNQPIHSGFQPPTKFFLLRNTEATGLRLRWSIESLSLFASNNIRTMSTLPNSAAADMGERPCWSWVQLWKNEFVWTEERKLRIWILLLWMRMWLEVFEWNKVFSLWWCDCYEYEFDGVIMFWLYLLVNVFCSEFNGFSLEKLFHF